MTVSFNKPRGRWVYDFELRGRRYQGYCLSADGQPVTSKRAAQQSEGVARRLADIAPKLPHGSDVTLAMVIGDLQPRWMRERGWKTKQLFASEILSFFGSATLITAIDQDNIHRYISYALDRPIRVWTGARSIDRDSPEAAKHWKDTGRTRSPATVNRYLSVLRLILGRAATMRDPITQELVLPHPPKFKDLPEPKRRARPTPEPVMERLQALLPPHAIDGLVLTLCFGFRSSEAFGLLQSQVDWHAGGVRLFYEGVKDKTDVFLPGSQFAMGYLRCLAIAADERLDRKGQPMQHLISYRRHPNGKGNTPWRPIKSARSAWDNAMKVIEKEFGRRWRWHDLRAAFITHIAMTSGPLAAQTLARHSDFDTTRGYIEVADELTRVAADRAADRPALRVVGGSKVPDESP